MVTIKLLTAFLLCNIIQSILCHSTSYTEQFNRDLSSPDQHKEKNKSSIQSETTTTKSTPVANSSLLLDIKLIQNARLTNEAKPPGIVTRHDNTCYDRIRLPDHIKPQHYRLIIEPDMKYSTFQAAIDIDIAIDLNRLIEYKMERLDVASYVNDSSDYVEHPLELEINKTIPDRLWKRQIERPSAVSPNQIIVHLNKLDIIDAWYSYIEINGIVTTNKIKEVCICKKYQIAVFKLNSNLINGKGRLHINYKGKLRDDMKGFYKSVYTNFNGDAKYHATTQFQATDARSALPCFDEPALKSTFDIVLIVPKDRLALSNTHAIAELDLGDGKKAVRFATTPLMSTYLLAFIVGEFDFIEGISRGGHAIRVYTPLGKTRLGEFALDVALRCLPFLEDYFKIEFPLSKIDLVAIPDFESGAMENWGLITYRETQLLIDDENSSVYRKTLVAKTVAHELAHQWFGNLVTMSWWNDLWLNEGFATYMEYFVVNELFPEYRVMVNFINEAHTPALTEDAMHSTHPIQASVDDPSEIEEIFDNISYFKGASTVKLLRDYLTDDIFRAGLQHYLSVNAYNNTVTDDLWDSFEYVSNKPIKDMMYSWTNQAGFPCLDVSIVKQDQNKTELYVAQQRFFADGSKDFSDNDNRAQQWIIPLAIITGDNNNKNITYKSLIADRATRVTVENNGQWIKLNPDFGGFYCVDYSKQLRAALYPAIKFKQLSVLDRINLLTDAHSLTLAGKLSADELLRMITYYKEEDDGAVWQVIDDVYGDMSKVIKASTNSSNDKFKEFGRQLFENIYNTYGWDKQPNESVSTTIARPTILLTCLLNNYKPAIEEGLKRFEMFVSGRHNLVDPSIRGVVYFSAAQYGNDSQFEKLFDLYNQTDLQETQNVIASSMTNIERYDRVQKAIKWIMSDAVRHSQRSEYLMALSASDIAKRILWKMIDDNFYALLKKFGLELLKKIIWTIGSLFRGQVNLVKKEINEFFARHNFEDKERTKEDIMSVVNSYAKSDDRIEKSIEKFLNDYTNDNLQTANTQQFIELPLNRSDATIGINNYNTTITVKDLSSTDQPSYKLNRKRVRRMTQAVATIRVS